MNVQNVEKIKKLLIEGKEDNFFSMDSFASRLWIDRYGHKLIKGVLDGSVDGQQVVDFINEKFTDYAIEAELFEAFIQINK